MNANTTWPDAGTAVVTDGGLETWLVFLRGQHLPAFAAYPLAGTSAGRALLTEYYEHYASIAARYDASVVLEAPTWRANPEWAATLGHDLDTLAGLFGDGVRVVQDVRSRWPGSGSFLVGGTVGPRGDGYVLGATMTVAEAESYHTFQVQQMVTAGVDVITAMTMGYVEEAVGIARAARAVGLPAVVSFTLETDGRLPSGSTLGDAIAAADAATDGYPTHYMINCAHPTHFEHALAGGESWIRRIGGLRANASTLSHAELDQMEVLDDGDPIDLAARYVQLRVALPALLVVGGCCGTDERHVAAIAAAWHATA